MLIWKTINLNINMFDFIEYKIPYPKAILPYLAYINLKIIYPCLH